MCPISFLLLRLWGFTPRLVIICRWPGIKHGISLSVPAKEFLKGSWLHALAKLGHDLRWPPGPARINHGTLPFTSIHFRFFLGCPARIIHRVITRADRVHPMGVQNQKGMGPCRDDPSR